MAIDTVTPRSRRAVLFGALGATVAAAASVIGRSEGARAADGDTVLLGKAPSDGDNQATATTKMSTTTGDGLFALTSDTTGAGLHGKTTAATGPGFGVFGEMASGDDFAAAIYGHATSTTGYVIGVQGQSEGAIGSGIAGYATSTSGFTIGAEGDAVSPDGAGVWGWNSASGTGATGIVGADYHDTVSVARNTGVLGVASDATGDTIGVMGRAVSTGGTGVIGVIGPDNLAPSANTGVYGQSDTGTSVWGATTSGTGGRFQTSAPQTGTALRAIGRVRFDHSVGIATVPSGQIKVVVTPGLALGSASAVVATLQGSAGGTTTVRYVAVNAAAHTFTIFLTKATTASVKVAWHVFG